MSRGAGDTNAKPNVYFSVCTNYTGDSLLYNSMENTACKNEETNFKRKGIFFCCQGCIEKLFLIFVTGLSLNLSEMHLDEILLQ